MPTKVTIWSLLMAAWIGGMAFAFLRLLRGCHVMRRVVMQAAIPLDTALSEVAGEVARDLGFGRVPHVLVTQEAEAPFVWGLVRPVVVLPARLVGRMSREQLRAVLAHEFAHLRRRDAVTGWLLALCEVPYFFHPAFHLAKRRLMFEREAASDDCALGLANAPRSLYAETLVAAAEACGKPRHHVLPVVTATESFQDLRRRIVLICSDLQRTARLSTRVVLLLALIVGISLPGVVLTARGAQERKGDAAGVERPLPAGAVMRLGTTRLRHSDTVRSLAFTPDGKALVSTAFIDAVRVWDTATGRQIRALGEELEGTYALALCPDGKRLITVGRAPGDKLRVWDLAAGTVLMSAPGDHNGINCLALSPDGETFATAGQDRNVYVWKMENGLEFSQTPLSVSAMGPGIWCLAFSSDGKLLAAGNYMGTVQIWEVGSDKEPLTVKAHSDRLGSIAFAPDGKALASGGAHYERIAAGKGGMTGEIRLWDIETGAKRVEFQTDAEERCIEGVSFSPDGKILASVGSGSVVSLWDAATGRRVRTVQAQQDRMSSHGAVAFSPDGRLLATGGPGNVIRLWNVASGEPIFSDPAGHRDVVQCVAISPDGRLVGSSSGEGTIRLWDSSTGQQLRALRGSDEWVYALAFGENGKVLAAAGSEGVVRLWDPGSGEEVRSFPGEDGVQAYRVAFSPDGNLIAALYYSKETSSPRERTSTVRVWQTGTGEQLLALGPVDGWGSLLSFSADGKVVICDGARGTLGSWDIPAGTERPPFKVPGQASWQPIAFSRDAGIIAYFDGRGEAVGLWEPATGEMIRSISTTGEVVWHVGFSGDNALVAIPSQTASSGEPRRPLTRLLRVFEMATGREVANFDTTEESGVSSLAFTPDKRRLVTGMANSTILVWDLSWSK